MESKAIFKGVERDFHTGKPIIFFMIDDLPPEAELNGELRLTVRRWKEKRSLDANAYLWVLCTAIASRIGSSKDEVYELMLDRYGTEYRDEDGGLVIVGVKKGLDLKKVGHWKHYKDADDGAYWYLLKGTSEYDSAEMSYFLDRVVEEAKELGIDTATPDELARIKQYGL